METTLTIVSIIIIVFGILQIILFFKIWGMTNNVNEIKNMMELKIRNEFQNKKTTSVPHSTNPIEVSRGWNNNITEEDKNKAKGIIPRLHKDEVIIKLIKSNKIIVYNEEDLYELADEEYKVIYH